MGKINGSIGNVTQGVSQQSPRDRLPGQHTEQINFSADATTGLTTRAPFKLTKIVDDDDINIPDTAAVYTYKRDNEEINRIIVTNSGDVLAYDSAYNRKQVEMVGATKSYLSSPDARKNLRFHTIGDVTVIANRTKVVSEGSNQAPSRPAGEALIYVKAGNYSRTYKVSITQSGTLYEISWATRDSSNVAHETDIQTEHIAEKLEEGINASSVSVTVENYDDVLYLYSSTSFDISVSDQFNGNDISVITNYARKLDDLPTHGPDGYMVRVGTADKNADSRYWLQLDNPNKGTGEWKERVAPGVVLNADITTMPHVLIRKSDGNFKVGPFGKNFDDDLPNKDGYVDRDAGDDDTNPLRSFIDSTINDVATFQGRLIFISGENVVASRSNDHFNFYKESATTTSDADPIDIAVDGNAVEILNSAILFASDLVVLSSRTQQVLRGDETRTPKNAYLEPISSYDVALGALPVVSGSNVFFPTLYGEFTGMREFFIEQQTDVSTANDVSAHCNKYMKGEPVKLAASTTKNILAVLTDDDTEKMYIYEYYWQAQKKVQSAWSTWQLPIGMRFVDVDIQGTTMYLLVRDTSTLYALEADLSLAYLDGMDYLPRFDFYQSVNITTEADGRQSIGLNQTFYGDTPTFVRKNGEQIAVEKVEGLNKFYLTNNIPENSCIVGIPIEARWDMTTPRVKDDKNRVVSSSRQQLMYVHINFNDSGEFLVTTTIGEEESELKHSARVIGGDAYWLRDLPIESGTFKVPVRASTETAEIRVETTSHYPLAVSDVEYTIRIRQRGRRV